MKLLKSIILRIKELLDNRQHNSDGVTSQQIVDKLQAHFKEVIEEMSTKETLVFPMTFTIYLHQKDYEKINPYFQAFGRKCPYRCRSSSGSYSCGKAARKNTAG